MLISEDQIQELYEINDDPKRKEFLDDLFSFMQKRGTPINRLPIMAKSVLDLYELYNLVIARGGLVDVINKKLWQEIIKGLHLPSSITSAAFTLRTQYMKYLYPYECEKKNLSTPAELQAAIDGNRREGRRSSYGQYEAMHSQLQMPQIGRQALPGGMQQMSPLALVTHAAAANNQQAQAAAAAAAAHHRLMAPTFGQMPNLMTHEIEQRMMEYLKLIQVKKEQNAAAVVAAAAAVNGSGGGGGGGGGGNNGGGPGTPHSHQSAQQSRRSPSPEITPREALNALEMSRVALWQMYHNNTSPPASVNTSPQAVASGGGGGGAANGGPDGGNECGGDGQGNGAGVEPQREALNLSDSPPGLAHIKREHDRDTSPVMDGGSERGDDFQHQPPPPKRLHNAIMPPGFPASFYLPHGMAAAAAAANFHHANAAAAVAAAAVNSSNNNNNHPLAHDSSDAEHEDEEREHEHDDDDEADGHNTTVNSSTHDDEHDERPSTQHLNGHHLHQPMHSHRRQLQQQQQHSHHTHPHGSGAGGGGGNDKSDDSAIENSPSTSAASAGNGHISPISTKKIHLSKPQACVGGGGGVGVGSNATSVNGAAQLNAFNPLDTLNLLSGLQFKVAANGTSSSGEQQLLVSLELNGLKYSGVLIANAMALNCGGSGINASANAVTAHVRHGRDVNDDEDDDCLRAVDALNTSTSSSGNNHNHNNNNNNIIEKHNNNTTAGHMAQEHNAPKDTNMEMDAHSNSDMDDMERADDDDADDHDHDDDDDDDVDDDRIAADDNGAVRVRVGGALVGSDSAKANGAMSATAPASLQEPISTA